MESFMVRPGGTELARNVHSISGSVTTVFLFTRLWARRHHTGLWWDDYILTLAWALQLIANGLAGSAPAYGFNIVNGTQRGQDLQFAASTVLYLALAASKSAFMITLLRLATSRSLRILLWSLLVTFSGASTAMGIISWLDLCETPHDMIHVSGVCISFNVLRWVHTGYAIFIVASDVFLACVPWSVISNIFLPKQEKIGVGMSMSLVGLAGLTCIARVAVMASLPVALPGGPVPDWTYGSVTILCMSQGEVAIYIVAQALPTIRVMVFGSAYEGSMMDEPVHSGPTRKGKTLNQELAQETPGGLELVQLPSGRIVPAASEEGRAFNACEAGRPSGPSTTTTQTAIVVQRGSKIRRSGLDDEVQRLWSDMRLSNKAKSKSPTTSPQLERHQRQISDTATRI